MSDTSPILQLPYILPSQAQKHVTHNEALRLLDVLVQPTVLDRDRTAPPASPAAGARHLVPAGATGAWAGHTDEIAVWEAETGVWRFLAPQPGWQTFVLAEGAGLVFTVTGWQTLNQLAPEFASLGISTAADETNRLAVASSATLLTHSGEGHQLKVNKATAGDTASLLFQTGWSGRAEIGLAGSDDLSVKVSPDGDTFRTALRVDRGTGRVMLPQGVTVTGSVTGTAVQASAADATAGRLLAVGAFGLGGAAPLIGNAEVADGSIAPGFYGYDSAQGSSGGPSGVQCGILLHQSRAAGEGEVQLFLVESASGAGCLPGILFSRARSGGAWSGWFAGGVVESASNANGRYIRHQDGTQTCWQSVTTLASGEAAITFPVPFSSTAGLMTMTGVNSAAASAICPRITGRTATGANVSAFNSSNARIAVRVELISMGRWY